MLLDKRNDASSQTASVVGVGTGSSGAVGTDSLDEVVETRSFVALGQGDDGYGDVPKTERAMAALAMEVGMLVIVLVVAVALTELVVYAFAAALDDVNQVLVAEKGEDTEDAGAVQCQQPLLQFCQRERTVAVGQGARHEQTVGCGSDVVVKEQFVERVIWHFRNSDLNITAQKYRKLVYGGC